MAVTTNQNVIRIAADNDTITGTWNICSIVYMPGSGTPTAAIKQTDTNGFIYWETAATARHNDQLELRLSGTTHFDLGGTGTVLYLYTEVE